MAKEIPDKEFRKRIVELMEKGELPEATAAALEMSIQQFEARTKANKKNARAYDLAQTKLAAYYQGRLKFYMARPPRNNELLKVFLSHYMKVMERKAPTEVILEQTGPSHEEALKELKGDT